MTGDSNPTDDAIALVRRIAARESWRGLIGKRWEDEAAEIVAKLDARLIAVPAGMVLVSEAELNELRGRLAWAGGQSPLVCGSAGFASAGLGTSGNGPGSYSTGTAPAQRGEAAENEFLS